MFATIRRIYEVGTWSTLTSVRLLVNVKWDGVETEAATYNVLCLHRIFPVNFN